MEPAHGELLSLLFLRVFIQNRLSLFGNKI